MAAIGNETRPVYIDAFGAAKACSREIPKVNIKDLYMDAPDYSATKTTVTDGWKASINGWILVRLQTVFSGTWNADVSINGLVVATAHHDDSTVSASWQDCQQSLVPISSGDTVTLNADAQSKLIVEFIPRKKIQIDANDFSATGGGVVDGTKYTLSNGEQKYTTTKNTSNNTAIQVYETENDCALFIEDVDAVGNYNDDVDVCYYLDADMTCPISLNSQSWIQCGGRKADGTMNVLDHDIGSQGRIINLKRGCKIYARLNTFAVDSTTGQKTSDELSTSIKYTFIEYKLTALAPQIAMPDWDENKKTVIVHEEVTGKTTRDIASGSFEVSKNGYIKVSRWGHIKTGTCKINDQFLSSFVENQLYDDACFIVPVSKGDLFSWLDITVGDTMTEWGMGGMISFVFYPCKIVQQTTEDYAALAFPSNVVTTETISTEGKTTGSETFIAPANGWYQVTAGVIIDASSVTSFIGLKNATCGMVDQEFGSINNQGVYCHIPVQSGQSVNVNWAGKFVDNKIECRFVYCEGDKGLKS